MRASSLIFAAFATALSASAALADGWRIDSAETPMLPKGEKLQVLSNGAAAFFCSKHIPLTFSVVISYEISAKAQGQHPPMRVTWFVDDRIGDTGLWSHQGLYVVADEATSNKVAAAASSARTLVGIQQGKLTSAFDVGGLASGLKRLKQSCS